METTKTKPALYVLECQWDHECSTHIIVTCWPEALLLRCMQLKTTEDETYAILATATDFACDCAEPLEQFAGSIAWAWLPCQDGSELQRYRRAGNKQGYVVRVPYAPFVHKAPEKALPIEFLRSMAALGNVYVRAALANEGKDMPKEEAIARAPRIGRT